MRAMTDQLDPNGHSRAQQAFYPTAPFATGLSGHQAYAGSMHPRSFRFNSMPHAHGSQMLLPSYTGQPYGVFEGQQGLGYHVPLGTSGVGFLPSASPFIPHSPIQNASFEFHTGYGASTGLPHGFSARDDRFTPYPRTTSERSSARSQAHSSGGDVTANKTRSKASLTWTLRVGDGLSTANHSGKIKMTRKEEFEDLVSEMKDMCQESLRAGVAPPDKSGIGWKTLNFKHTETDPKNEYSKQDRITDGPIAPEYISRLDNIISTLSTLHKNRPSSRATRRGTMTSDGTGTTSSSVPGAGTPIERSRLNVESWAQSTAAVATAPDIARTILSSAPTSTGGDSSHAEPLTSDDQAGSQTPTHKASATKFTDE
ncbi:uncharacterized protein I303_101481 [Kwoniella dejecticola CBS 10117]|uniref:Uncharacterized protein n=1 Tax=Kwoniella dejecticola CBS 10117 TaxID=1296121 RepID=A0A1A6ADL6_9TREE|nr:uncharacterized protein I303_02386 [Kwoniella dejecticola CBS 10117]OBR88166.1 hypothetical protein I303_02386 [Kwoniella dejecticola CBS 10117]